MKKIIFFLLFAVLPFACYADKITVIYTGNSYSALYPCGHCPASVGGGVSRRASVINDMRDKQKNILLIDAGNFTAGGTFDDSSINPELDKRRTVYNEKAMKIMGYDAVGIGESEFNFGTDFFKNNIKKNGLRMVSSNLEIKDILPYFIKDLSGIRVGIVGLSPETIYKMTGLTVNDYEKSLRDIIAKIENKVQLIILISSIGEEQTKKLIKRFPEIGLVLLSGNITDSSPYQKIDETIIMKPSYLSKELRFADFNVKSKKIVGFEFKTKKLSTAIEDNHEITKLIPSCFVDADCSKKEGLMAKCQNSGTDTAACAYFEPDKIEAIVITDNTCPFCSTEMTKKALKEVFPGIDYKIIDYKTAEAGKLIKKYSINTLPAFILPKDVKNEKGFLRISNFSEEKQDRIILKPELSGLFLFLDRKKIPEQIDFFISLHDASSLPILNELSAFCAKQKVKFNIYFILERSKNIGYPVEEVRIAYAVKKVAPEKFIDYIKTRLKDIAKTSWPNTAEALGINYKKLQEIENSKDITRELENNDKLVISVNVTSGNVLLINNTMIFKAFKINEKDLEKLFK